MFMSKTYLITFHHHRLRHAYVTYYSTNHRRHLMFMAKLLNKLPQLMSQLTPMCLQSTTAFLKHQVTQYIISHACPVGTHEDATMAKDSLHWSSYKGLL